MTGAEAIVIGGGIAGVSAAARLAKHMSVILLEAEKQFGYHSTGRSAAIFIRNYGNATLRQLNAASASFFETPDEIGETSLLTPRGEMLVAAEDELEDLAEYAAGATGLELLSPQEAVDLVPILRQDKIAAAAIEWDAQDIDVDRMLAGFLRLFKSRGGRSETGGRVKSIAQQDGTWSVETETGSYKAPIVVNAAGAWASHVGAMAKAAKINLTPMRRSAAILPAPQGCDTATWPLFASASERWYAKPTGGKLMVSPADEDPVDAHDAWVDDMVLAEGLHRYEQMVTAPVTRVENAWAGLRTFASDRTPVVGFDPVARGFFWLAGQGGYGVQTAPALAEMTEKLCTNDTSPFLAETMAALSPSRFT